MLGNEGSPPGIHPRARTHAELHGLTKVGKRSAHQARIVRPEDVGNYEALTGNVRGVAHAFHLRVLSQTAGDVGGQHVRVAVPSLGVADVLHDLCSVDNAGAHASVVLLQPCIQLDLGAVLCNLRHRQLCTKVSGKGTEAARQYDLCSGLLCYSIVAIHHPALPVELVAGISIINPKLGASLEKKLAAVNAERSGSCDHCPRALHPLLWIALPV
mmetsp:Transcript_77065/g.107083  ORF Transcript_77065/g.107083 Transcript_77065/m.107083 type:complete len:214 (-) Transcript_77065:148-789(-)